MASQTSLGVIEVLIQPRSNTLVPEDSDLLFRHSELSVLSFESSFTLGCPPSFSAASDLISKSPMFWLLCHGLQRFWLGHCDNCRALTKTWFWCWNSACAGVMSAFVFLSAAIPWVLTLTFIGSIALSKGPWRFWLHCHEYSHALMLGCWNSPWWQSCEHCNKVCLPSGCLCSLDSNSMVVTCLVH